MIKLSSDEFSNPHFRLSLKPRNGSYHYRLGVGRFVGYHKPRPGPGFWTARYVYGAKNIISSRD